MNDPPKELRLMEATPAMRDAFLEMAREWCANGSEGYADALTDFDGFMRYLREMAAGRNLEPGHVRQVTYWLTDDAGRILGCSRLRTRLTPTLAYHGGHIGYDVRPSERRKGYGTRLLALTLEKARKMGLNRLLLTCDDDNVGSARIIERNGGVLQDRIISPETGKLHRRYLIEL